MCFTRLPVDNDANACVSLPEKTGGVEMKPVRILAIALIVAGVLGLAYGSFSYTKDTHETKLGPIALSIKETQTVNVPVWAGVGAIVAGVILLFVRNK